MYDHFLAKNWDNYSSVKLEDFVNQFYKSLQDNKNVLSPRAIAIMPILMQENWLFMYRSIEGINHILTQMDRRTKNQSKMRFANNELVEFYSEFEGEFTEFFTELILFSNEKIITL